MKKEQFEKELRLVFEGEDLAPAFIREEALIGYDVGYAEGYRVGKEETEILCQEEAINHG